MSIPEKTLHAANARIHASAQQAQLYSPQIGRVNVDARLNLAVTPQTLSKLNVAPAKIDGPDIFTPQVLEDA